MEDKLTIDLKDLILEEIEENKEENFSNMSNSFVGIAMNDAKKGEVLRIAFTGSAV